MDTIKAFSKFNNEGNLIGLILSAYADLELSLFHCVNSVRNDFDSVYKIMFSERGETRRVKTAKILGLQQYHSIGLGSHFEMAISSMQYCLKIRNQYAHCVWYDDLSDLLAFTNLEKITKKNAPIANLNDLPIHHIDVTTLLQQKEYFEYTELYLKWINFEGRHIRGIPSMPEQPPPKQIERPLLSKT